MPYIGFKQITIFIRVIHPTEYRSQSTIGFSPCGCGCSCITWIDYFEIIGRKIFPRSYSCIVSELFARCTQQHINIVTTECFHIISRRTEGQVTVTIPSIRLSITSHKYILTLSSRFESIISYSLFKLINIRRLAFITQYPFHY